MSLISYMLGGVPRDLSPAEVPIGSHRNTGDDHRYELQGRLTRDNPPEQLALGSSNLPDLHPSLIALFGERQPTK